MILLTVDDFTGFFELAQSTANIPLLQSYIDRYERDYIHRLLGVELGELYIADLTAPSAPYTTLTNAFYEQDDCDVIWSSLGMKDFLKAAVFYHYVFQEQVQHSQSGVTISLAETSHVVTPENAAAFARRRYNACCVTYPTSDKKTTAEAIQWKCETDDPDSFPTYNGTKIKVLMPF